MRNEFRWLHISDFHAGMDKTAQELQLSHVISHVEQNINDGFLPNAVFITGDVAQAGLNSEYALFRSGFLDKIQRLAPEAEIVFVPGNHDLVRPTHPEQHNRSFLANESKCSFFDASEEAKNSRAYLIDGFREFSRLPGCEWVLGADGFRHISGESIDILCFNTAWIAWGGDENFSEKGNLPIGAVAIGTAFSKVQSGKGVLVLGHHPIEWLTSDSRNALLRELRKRGGIYLCGHEHKAILETYVSFNNEAHQLRAGASFLGRLPEGQDWTNSLIWGEFKDSEQGQLLRVQPRRWSNADGYIHWASNFPCDPADGGWYEFILKPANGKQTRIQSSPAHRQHITESIDASIPNSLEDFLYFLESQFEFTFQKSSRSQGIGEYVVFWPVRARQPTLVHAMQAFSAAGLTRLGAIALLVIDDLAGQTKLSTTDLEGAIKRWFHRVGASTEALRIFKLSELQTEINKGKQWVDLITKWFALQTEYKLPDILNVSKIDSAKISDKKARKLLTPTLIWSAFSVLMEKHEASRFVTLGGADERALWEAWRSCIDDVSVANHIYNPEVKDDQGQRFNLDEIGWSSYMEIRDTLLKCLQSYKLDLKNPPTYWLPYVAYRSCVVLPALISKENPESWETIISQHSNPTNLARKLAAEINAWYLLSAV